MKTISVHVFACLIFYFLIPSASFSQVTVQQFESIEMEVLSNELVFSLYPDLLDNEAVEPNNLPSLNPFDKEEVRLVVQILSPSGALKEINGFIYHEFPIVPSSCTISSSATNSMPFLNPEEISSYQILDSELKWLVRFTPQEVGQYEVVGAFFDIKDGNNIENVSLVERASGASVMSGFASAPNPQEAGFVSLKNKYQFEFSNGSPFHPLGFNIPSVADWNGCTSPIEYYDRYFAQMKANGANFSRLWLSLAGGGNHPRFFGLDYRRVADGASCSYLSHLRLPDAYLWDVILEKAAEHDIYVQLCFFVHNDFDGPDLHETSESCVSNVNTYQNAWPTWNPYYLHSNGPIQGGGCSGFEGMCVERQDFFTLPEARKMQKIYIDYIMDRYSHSKNVIVWELMNEFNQVGKVPGGYSNTCVTRVEDWAFKAWHDDLGPYIKSKDIYNRSISSSIAGSNNDIYQGSVVDYFSSFEYLDIVEYHAGNDMSNWGQNKSVFGKKQTDIYFNNVVANVGSNKSVIIGEHLDYFGGPMHENSQGHPNYKRYDPNGFLHHANIWSTLFTPHLGTSMNWGWEFFLEHQGTPLINYTLTDAPSTMMKNFIGIDKFISDSEFSLDAEADFGYVDYNNRMQCHFVNNHQTGKIFGWVQDNGFNYGNLQTPNVQGPLLNHLNEYGTYLSGPRPDNASINGHFVLDLNCSFSLYDIEWYDTITGDLIHTDECVEVLGGELQFEAPDFMRNLAQFGDAAFVAKPSEYQNGWSKRWTNEGDGSLSWWAPGSTTEYVSADFDGDGNDELFCAEMIEGEFNHAGVFQVEGVNWINHEVWYNYGCDWIGQYNGNGQCEQQWSMNESDRFYAGDFDGDGKAELLCVSSSENSETDFAMMLDFENGNWLEDTKWSNHGSDFISTWQIDKSDKFIIGDYDGDGADELMCVQSGEADNKATMLHFEAGEWNESLEWNNNWCNQIYPGNSCAVEGWTIQGDDRFVSGNFDGEDRDQLLCVQESGEAAMIMAFGMNEWSIFWSNNNNGNLGGWDLPLQSSDRLLVGNIDGQDQKDELLVIQTGMDAHWALLLSLKEDLQSWNWKWEANHDNAKPLINDWVIADHNSEAADYELIRTVSGAPKWLFAARKGICKEEFLCSTYAYSEGEGGAVRRNLSFDVEVDLELFPNPATDVLQVKCSRSFDHLTIYDLSGRIILSKSNLDQENIDIELTQIESGNYFLEVIYGDQKTTKKFIKN